MRDLPGRALTRLYERRRRSRDYHGKTLVIRVRSGRKVQARADEMEAQRGARAQTLAPTFYRRPEDRKRETGSATACRRNTQRATAKPRAA